MAAAAGEAEVPFGHEGHGLALEEGDLLDAVLVDRMAVGHLERFGVAEVELGLARAPFALGELDRDAGGVHAVADRPDQALFLGGLEDVVVLDVPAGGLELFVDLGARHIVRLVEHVELELGRHVDLEALLSCAGDLALQDRARAVRHVFPMVVDDVAEHERRALQPRDLAQGREVRADREIAVALVPGRGRVARHRLHVHVEREQVVAGVHLVHHLLEEVVPGDPLADQPALHVDEAGEHGVDRTAPSPPASGS